MNIKVDRLKLIKALKDALQEREHLKIANDNIMQLNVTATEAYEKKLLELIYTRKLEVRNVCTRSYYQEPIVEVTFKLPRNVPSAPTMIDTTFVGEHEVTELKNAIKLLEMSDVEEVNAGTYKSVVSYIK
jgi:hypothetical protein